MLYRNLLKLISLYLSFLLLACGRPEQPEEQQEDERFRIEAPEPSVAEPEKNVNITGKTDDPDAFQHLNLLDFSNFGFSPYQNPTTREIVDDSLLLQLHNVNQPQLMDVVAFSGRNDTLPYFTRILVSPGDSIHLTIRNGKMSFSGKNEAHYNFFLEMNDPLRQNWAVYQNDPYAYKEALKQAYESKEAKLRTYIEQHPEVSQQFEELVSAELKFEFLYNLILPRNVKDPLIEGNYHNNEQDIMMVNVLNNPASESFLNPTEFFDELKIEDFKRP